MVCSKLIAVPFNHLPVTGTVGNILVLFPSKSGTGKHKITKEKNEVKTCVLSWARMRNENSPGKEITRHCLISK